MARSTTGKSRFKIQRSLGIELPGLGKAGALERRPYGPGQHGNKRKKISDFAVRQKEKQKLRYHYGLREGQLVNYVKKAKKDKSRAWMDSLLITLESRLSNVIFRLNWAPSMLAANQMVSHGHVVVNGKKINVPGYTIKKGDVITLTDRGYASLNFTQAQATPRLPSVPACYSVDAKTAKVVDLPLPSDIPFEYAGQLVTEFYWKVKP
ncbi:30S ribosomal protein S4 [Bacteriovorax stolpii]|uniref:Small ribosomal subunit protein uS4 n=1 Tax=Bacteriovorax stolpii TaxID=960 RepID=A0A2K9NTM8_BACTC|nr:30S ribosomal protein S4 [Bacteriovorax stolpii]AUN98848.1 30S ribosomal protein S4 [Bacteriovorax stolpii]QDK41157.1 30S ribosomal protein S4 [Bacteriovorax stolpii]TDP55632.1 SSU ribosomal protein S4P [Bacteriovorax stolpii]BDT29000.1 30S ribosomal protein S4 [Bacteriovorax sp. HI3]